MEAGQPDYSRCQPHICRVLRRSENHAGVCCGCGQGWDEMSVSSQSLSLESRSEPQASAVLPPGCTGWLLNRPGVFLLTLLVSFMKRWRLFLTRGEGCMQAFRPRRILGGTRTVAKEDNACILKTAPKIPSSFFPIIAPAKIQNYCTQNGW